MRKDNTLIIPALNAGPSIFFILNMSDKELEEGLTLRLDFKKLRKIASGQEDVIPAIAQDAQTGEVLILGYVNELALKTALKEKKATFWSTSRNELWIKGLTSGDFLELLEVVLEVLGFTINVVLFPFGVLHVICDIPLLTLQKTRNKKSCLQ